MIGSRFQCFRAAIVLVTWASSFVGGKFVVSAPPARADESPAKVTSTLYYVGAAQRDITPKTPIRLAGFGFRREESVGVTAPLRAKSLAIRQGGGPAPIVIVTVESCGVPATMVEALRERLEREWRIPRENVAVSFTHSHTAPMLSNTLSTLFGMPIPEAHQERIDRYTRELADALFEVASESIQGMRPARLEWGVGEVDFAANRRTRGGPVDHDLPVLAVRDAENRVRAVLTTYACHCVTLSNNKVGGDWAGFAMEAIQREWPDAVALVTIGCGADQNPASGVTGDRVETAQAQGAAIASEVSRLLRSRLAPISGPLTATLDRFPLPLVPLPTAAEWAEKGKAQDAIGYHARTQLARLERGEALRTQIDYSVQTFAFGRSLAMAFLPGEVVVDYATRLKQELDGRRVWLHGYSNDAPGYVPSERILKEGGYEGGGAMVYYDIPVGYASGLEEKIVGAVRRPLDEHFVSPHDSRKLQGTRPLSPHQSLARMKVADELEVELVVAEPLVVDPVAIDFGVRGELWVAEMHDYPSGHDGAGKPGGRVRLVRDKNGDGWPDVSTVFLDGIPFPTGLMAWRSGVLVCAAPDILYAEDTDGDDRADVVRKAYSGFGVGNFQARVNSLVPGLDGWIYGSCGLFGGTITPFQGAPFELGDRDFRLRPDEGLIEPATGRTQQSRVRDDWGNWFGCDNSTLARHYPFDDHVLRAHPQVLPPPSGVVVARDADAVRMEPLRRDAQRFKLSGAPAGVTAACGLGVYRDTRLGDDYYGDLFTCEPVNLVVHRLKLEPDRSTFVGRRAANEADREFWATSDNWSRPVQAKTGPDGALWIVDMYRFVIEHPRWIPEDDLKQLDVRAGSSLGRIYRVRPRAKSADGKTSSFPPPLPLMDATTPEAWAEEMRSANGTRRDMAMLQIQWQCQESALSATSTVDFNYRQQRTLFAGALRPVARDPELPPAVRVQALRLIETLGMADTDDLRRAFFDTDAGLRRHALRMTAYGEVRGAKSPLGPLVITSAEHLDPHVRAEAALALAEWAETDFGRVLAGIAASDYEDPYLRTAVLCGVNSRNALSTMRRTVELGANDPRALRFLPQLLSASAPHLAARDTTRLVDLLAGATGQPIEPRHFAGAASLLDTPLRNAAPNARPLIESQRIKSLIVDARRVVQDSQLDAADRAQATMLLAREPERLPDDAQSLADLLAPQNPAPLQAAAFERLAKIDPLIVTPRLLDRWSQLTPAAHAQSLDILLSRPKSTDLLLQRLESRQLPLASIDAARRQRLLQAPDAALRERAVKLFQGATNPARAQVVAAFADVTTMKGDAVRGEAILKRVCINCHRWGESGHAIGPDLAAVVNKSPAALLMEILDPNRNIDSRHVQFTAVRTDGRAAQGILASESSTSITLLGPNGVRTEILRSELEELKNSGQSLMPEGLERDLSKQDLADLLALLTSVSASPKSLAGNKPTTVREQRGQWLLRATDAEIRGGDITFETEFQNIGYWHGVQDHVSWVVEVPRAGQYDVHLNGACAPDSAGNGWVLEVNGQLALQGKIASTGGWNQYAMTKVGSLKLEPGEQRWVLRPAGPTLRGALVDLRGLAVTTPGKKPDWSAPPAPQPPAGNFESAASLARYLLDDTQPTPQRDAAVGRHPQWAAELVVEMTRDLKPSVPASREEYRRIPWIWRAAIGAGKRAEPETWKKLLDVSLPAKSESLRDWQAVVVGGGLINGIAQQDRWPVAELERAMQDDEALRARWLSALEQAARMTDDEKVPNGTRYDALRMIAMEGWERRGEQLTRYLQEGINPELQMGAISGLSDVPTDDVVRPLLDALPHLRGVNRTLALDALLRTPTRRAAVRTAIERGDVRADWLTEPQRRRLEGK